MARCRECNARVWFRKVCAPCEERIRFLGREGFTRTGGVHTFQKTLVKQSTRIEIVINGKPVKISTNEPLSHALLEQIAAEAGVPLEALAGVIPADLLHGGAGNAGPLRKVECAGCARMVSARQGWCVYCGHELSAVPSETAGSATQQQDDVDERVLESDVLPAESESAKDKVRDSYRARLENL